jgi:hypothetical protein
MGLRPLGRSNSSRSFRKAVGWKQIIIIMSSWVNEYMDNINSRTNRRTMPICLSSEEFKMSEEYSKKKGMLNCSQALEYLATVVLNS